MSIESVKVPQHLELTDVVAWGLGPIDLLCVVLGGASLTGGVGTVFGAMLGVALLAILQNGLVLIGVSSYWNQWFVGLTILCAVAITAWSDRRRRVAKAIN